MKPSFSIAYIAGAVLVGASAGAGLVFAILILLAPAPTPTMGPAPTLPPPSRLPPPSDSLGPATILPFQRRVFIPAYPNPLLLTLDPSTGNVVSQVASDSTSRTYLWADTGTQLRVSLSQTAASSSTIAMQKIRLQLITSQLSSLTGRIGLGVHQWYGGAQTYHQYWDISRSNISSMPFVTNDIYKGAWGGVMERYWLSSGGVAVTVAEESALWVGLNAGGDGLLSLSAQVRDSLYANFADPTRTPPALDLTFWLPSSPDTASLRDLQLAMVANHLGKPSGTPDPRMMLQPIWSTWAKYKKEINATSVLEYANAIKDSGFNNSQLEIDDEWATHYGDMEMDAAKFPDPKGLTTQLKALGFRSTIWVHPFANLDSATALTPSNRFNWVQTRDGYPATVFWWDGEGLMLDPTNLPAAQWFVGRMKAFLSSTGIDSFKFDAGETNWLPASFRLANASYPNQFTHDYVENVVKQLGGMVETRVGSRSQDAPIFVRIMDKDSKWGYGNGLSTVLTVSLTFGILGYPFVLPDMIGGNAYGNGSDPLDSHYYPERELYVRWLQASVYLPAVQFSIAPFDYDRNLTEHAKTLLAAREGKADLFTSLAAEAVSSGSPMVRPTWWTGDESEGALTADDQFLLGDDFLVAPVLAQGATSRSVYLPERGAQWKSGLDGRVHAGAQTLTVSALLYQLPTFTRVPQPENFLPYH